MMLTVYVTTWPENPAAYDEHIKISDSNAIRDYITANLQPGDVVVGGRSSMINMYFMLLNINYYRQLPPLREKSFYTSHHLDIKDIILSTVYSPQQIRFISAPFYYRLDPADMFISFFQNASKRGWLENVHHVWFYSAINGEEWTALNLFRCPSLQHEITHSFKTSLPNMLTFSLPMKTISDIISPKGKYHHCLTDRYS